VTAPHRHNKIWGVKIQSMRSKAKKLGLTERIKPSVWKKLCCGTSSRSSEESIKSDNKESGLTIGLIVKDYSEYLGVKALLWNIVILSLIFSSIEYTYDGGQTSTIKAKSLAIFPRLMVMS
jgi:hypothetical protein